MEKIQIKIGDIKIGAGAPVSVQSMTNKIGRASCRERV